MENEKTFLTDLLKDLLKTNFDKSIFNGISIGISAGMSMSVNILVGLIDAKVSKGHPGYLTKEEIHILSAIYIKEVEESVKKELEKYLTEKK